VDNSVTTDLEFRFLRAEKVSLLLRAQQQRIMETVPQNVPQRYANQALHARYAAHARTFLLSGFVSVENKEGGIYLPKLDVAGSIPVARSTFCSVVFTINFLRS